MSGTWASTLLAAVRSALTPRAASRSAVARPKKATSVGTPLCDRRRRDIGRRLDAERRHAGGEEMLQQVAVVGGDLDHRERGPSSKRSIIASA